MTTVTLYTKPACVQCTMTKRMLQQAGITYTETDLTQNPTALEKVKKLGYLSAPVVITDKGQSWAGFQPERIKELTS